MRHSSNRKVTPPRSQNSKIWWKSWNFMKMDEISQNGWNFVEFVHFCGKCDFHDKLSPKSLKFVEFRCCFRSGAKRETEISEILKISENQRKSWISWIWDFHDFRFFIKETSLEDFNRPEILQTISFQYVWISAQGLIHLYLRISQNIWKTYPKMTLFWKFP